MMIGKMKSIMIKIKQKYFCNHQFERLYDNSYLDYSHVRRYKCSKCGKILYV